MRALPVALVLVLTAALATPVSAAVRDDTRYVQLRPASHWSGGDKWVTKIPSTRGKLVKRFFSFKPDKWTTLPELGKPAYPLTEALKEARGLVFVGKTPNDLEFQGLKIDGYRPPCVH